MAVFIVRVCNESDADGPIDLNQSKTESTCHTAVYFGCGGLSLNAPFKTLEINGCLPTSSPSTFSWTEEIADLYTFRERY